MTILTEEIWICDVQESIQAKGGDSSGGSTQTIQKADPWAGQQPYLQDVYAKAQTAAGQTPTTAYQGPLLADQNQAQQNANAQQIQLASGLQGQGGSTRQLAQDTISGKYLSSNPYLQPAINAAVRPVIENFNEQLMPALSTQANTAGAFGGARHAIQAARGVRDTERTIADVSARAAADNYARERGLQTQAPAMLQTAMQADQLPIEMLRAAGAEQQGWSQQDIDAAMARYQMDVEAPWQAIRPYAAIIQGFNPGGVTTGVTNTTLPRQNQLGSALGGAAGGAMAGSMIMPGWGTAIGGILGGLGGLFG